MSGPARVDTLGYRITGLPDYWLTGLLAYRFTGLPDYWLTGLLAYRITGLPDYWLTGLVARMFNTPKFLKFLARIRR